MKWCFTGWQVHGEEQENNCEIKQAAAAKQRKPFGFLGLPG